MRVRESGTIVKWLGTSYGFIQPDPVGGRQSADVFCSYHGLEPVDGVRMRSLLEGQRVSYELGHDGDNRICAVRVRVE